MVKTALDDIWNDVLATQERERGAISALLHTIHYATTERNIVVDRIAGAIGRGVDPMATTIDASGVGSDGSEIGVSNHAASDAMVPVRPVAHGVSPRMQAEVDRSLNDVARIIAEGYNPAEPSGMSGRR